MRRPYEEVMMHRVYRPSRKRRTRSSFRFISSTAGLAVIGAAVFYAGMTWFRSHTTVSPELAAASEAITETLTTPSVSAAEFAPTKANLVSAFDGQVTGVVNRTQTEQSSDFHVLVYLPGLDRSVETYAVWLLKDGLADVKRMGELSARADGSWTLDFTAGPVSGIATPDAYKTVVIMKSPKGSGDTPAGVKMAEAVF